MAILALLCLAFGVLPTYVIAMLDPASAQVAAASATDALVPPFFAAAAGHGTLPPAFAAEFHDLGAQVGQSMLPGRGSGGAAPRRRRRIRWSSPCPRRTCWWR